MENSYQIIEVGPDNIHKTGFFCYMSKPKSPGYRQKREWLVARFAEGMQIKILHENGGRDVAFIEYIPGQYAWRAVNAAGYMVIHCLWVVGKGKGKGYGSILIQDCLAEARSKGMHGVAMVSSDGTWLASKDIFLDNGFVEIDQAPPSFQLLVHRFGSAPDPAFVGDWEARLSSFGPGLTVVRSDQCPYNENATHDFIRFASESNLPARVVELHSAQEVRETAPCAYGTYGVVLNGRLFSYTYLIRADFEKKLAMLSTD